MSAKAGTELVVRQVDDPRGGITFEEIAVRAYEIHVSGTGGADVDDWLRAEAELNAELHVEQDVEAEQGLDEATQIAV